MHGSIILWVKAWWMMIHASLNLLLDERDIRAGSPSDFADDRYCEWRWERAVIVKSHVWSIAKTVERKRRRELNRLGLIYCLQSACKTHFDHLLSSVTEISSIISIFNHDVKLCTVVIIIRIMTIYSSPC